MPEPNDVLDTLGAEVDEQDDTELDTQGDESEEGDEAQDEYFLTVNERQKYKSADEVIKALGSAGQRIGQLTPYEKIAKQFGIKDPTELIPLLNKAQKAQLEADAAAAKKGNEGASDVFSDPNLTPVQKRALQWLKDNAAKVGYVPKSELETVQAQIKKLEQGFTEQSEKSKQSHMDGLVKEGKSYLRSFLTEAKLATDNKDFVGTVEDAVAAYIEKDEERLERFYAGGEELKGVVKEAFDAVAKVFNLVKAKATAELAQKKTEATKKANKVLPRNGTVGTPQKQAQKQKGLTKDVHNAAWEKFKSKLGQTEEAES